MPRRCGPTLCLREASDADLDWIRDAMQRRAIYEPLSLPRPPTAAEIASGQLPLVEEDGRDVDGARFLIMRRRSDDNPVAFWLHYGWSHPTDTTRELDLAVPEEIPRSLGMFLEGHLLCALYLFGETRAKRLRWRVALGGRPLRWYGRLGARPVGALEQPNPVSGVTERKQVYEITKGELGRVLGRIGLDPGAEDLGEINLWEVLRGSGGGLSRGG